MNEKIRGGFLKVFETIRKDGLRVVTGKVRSKKVFLQLRAGVGSANDPEEKSGLQHYFEHMAFKGTAARDANAISVFLGRNVLSHNASTDRLETEYNVQSVQRKWQLSCDFLCDIYFNSIYPEDEIEKEKEVVGNEIAGYWDDDNSSAHHALCGNLWKENPMRIFGAGTPESVKNINRDDLIETRNYWHVPSNTLAIGVGNIDHEEFVAEINRRVPLCDAKVLHPRWSDEYETLPQKSEIIIERPGREKAIMIYGCKFPSFIDDVNNRTIQFLEFLLAMGQTSLLWKEIREKRGLAYSVFGGVGGEFPLGCCFYVTVETLQHRIEEVRELVYKFVHSPLQNRDDMETTREFLFDWYSLEYGCDDLEDWASLMRSKIRKNISPKTAEKYFEKNIKIISKLSLNEVESMRQQTLKPEKFVTVVVKPA